MHLSVVHVETFLAVARTGSMTAAAAMLSYSLSTVSDHVNQLECRLSSRLFDRTGAGCALTFEGERVAPLAERLLDAHDALCIANGLSEDSGRAAAASRRKAAYVADRRGDGGSISGEAQGRATRSYGPARPGSSLEF